MKKQFEKREIKTVIILISNSFSWYFPLYILFANMLDNLHLERGATLCVYSLHYSAIIIFAVIGVVLETKVGRHKLLSMWMVIGAVVSLLILLARGGDMGWVYSVSFLLGLSLGLGFPSCLAYFADRVDNTLRGTVGGVTYFLTSMGMFAIGFMTTMSDFPTSVLILAIWRSVGLIAFLLMKGNDERPETTNAPAEIVFKRRALILYLIPWAMFCLINFLEIPFFDMPLQQYFLRTNLRYLISIGEFGIGGFSALIAGRLSDRIGRKRMIVSAYVMIGIGYAVLGFSYSNIIALYLYVLLDGVAWGVFALMFYLIIWGDLATGRSRQRYYLIGTLPFLVSSFVSVLAAPYSAAVSLSTAFSLASFFLFLAILPLIYAPETLPERQMKERELKDYVEKARKTKEKYT